MIEKNTKKNILTKSLIVISCIVLSIAFAFGLKTMIDYQKNNYNEERPYGDTLPTVTISGSSTVYVGNTITLTASVSDGSVHTFSWSSSNTANASVSNTGIVTGIVAGSVTITATSTTNNQLTASKTITVSTAPTGPTTPCSAGQWRGENSCETCPVGYWCDGSSKTSCGTGKTSLAGSDDSSDCYSTNQCQAGNYYDTASSSCEVCEIDYYCPGNSEKHKCPYGTKTTATGKTAVTDCISVCSSGQYYQSSDCKDCEAGFYCDSINRKACPTGMTSPAKATNVNACVVATGCKVEVSTESKRVSVDSDDIENSYYIVNVKITGNQCGGLDVNYSATNAKKVLPEVRTNVESGETYQFKVYPSHACRTTTAKATLTNNESDTVNIPMIYNDWSMKDGCWSTAEVGDKPKSFEEADKKGLNEYYTNLGTCTDSSGQTINGYKTRGYRYNCDPGDEPTVNNACYMNKTNGVYEWGNHANDNNYELIPNATADTCKNPSGTGDEKYACYKDDNKNYKWDITAPEGYKLVESIIDEENCKLNDNAACYKDTNGKYAWGDYSNNSSYQIIEGIKSDDKCLTPDGCYRDAKGNYVWGNYAYNDAYTILVNVNTKEKCGDIVKVPATGATTEAIIYVSIIIMLIAGGSFVYYVYNKKRFS